MHSTTEWLRRRLPELIAEHGVVGAQAAVLVDGEIFSAAAGVLNSETRAPVTGESLFQIASITKIWTATLVQELANEGLLDLDRPVRDVLPEFRPVVTPRHLLTHTAGIEGDLFFDTGTGDHAVEKFVALLADAEQVSPPGELWSYCNSGFSVLGRIVEVLRGKPFNTLLRERLADPLGLTIETHIVRGAHIADGHLDGGPVSDYGPVSDFPAGSALATSARDLLAFVRMHFGTPGLAVMRRRQFRLPDLGDHCSWGLGWMIVDGVDGTVIGHNGGNKGIESFLRVVPETGVAVAVLTNGGDAQPVFDAVREQFLGVRAHPRPVPPAVPIPVDLARVAGVYRCAGYDVHVTPADEGRVQVRYEGRTELTRSLERPVREFTVLHDNALIAVDEPHTVLGVNGRWLYFGQNAERVDTPAEWITRRLPELLEEHGVVGAQVAVLHDGRIVDAAAGLRRNDSNEPVTTDSLFQIGSITKIWTATLVMQLVHEGLLDLDRPVRDVLPEFRPDVTPRHLLTHTAGFEGDKFAEVDSGDPDTIETYVAQLSEAVQISPPGELNSYCNAGYVVLGRIVEVLRGKPFHAALREHLVDPLGLTHVATHLAEYPGHQVASGHLRGKPVDEPFREWDAPAGRVLAMNARDLLTFVRMHLETTAFAAMREPQIALPDFGFGGHQGLGWMLLHYDNGVEGIGHTGLTMGYQAILRAIPQAGVAVVVLTNGGRAVPLVQEIYDHLLGELCGVRLPAFPTPPVTPLPVDVDEVVGTYRSGHVNLHVTPGAPGRVRVRYEPRNRVGEALMVDEEREYTGLREDALISVEPSGGRHAVIVLCRQNGHVRWLHFGRAATKGEE
ncbi:serine hydrolase domain-containing protein [Lentzea sp. NPDC051838]|uniref:serine hydrolase domain-containing protein n=1 Tax=Lentzea sp. NPDC051838 TaxID=3154849 RepID=UPI0034227470